MLRKMARYYNDIWMDDELSHFGIPGMKWGVHRYQNADGSLTSAGKKRYNKLASKYAKSEKKKDKYKYKFDKHYAKTSMYYPTGHHAKLAAKYDRKVHKQEAKMYRQKKKMEKLMKKTNMTLNDAYANIELDPVTMERIKAMFA